MAEIEAATADPKQLGKLAHKLKGAARAGPAPSASATCQRGSGEVLPRLRTSLPFKTEWRRVAGGAAP